MYQDKLGIKDVKNIILISSGKGGVGKSTVSSNIAAALHKKGNRVGILDADIYGPSQAKMFGIDANISLIIDEGGKTIKPYVTKHGLKLMSIATRIDDSTSLNWRGSMITMVLQQLLYQTNWGELDYLVIDMPPGTGDIQIYLTEKLKDAHAVIVTTPQEVSLIDCKKGIDVFLKGNISILGIVENMSVFICPCCGHEEHVFGKDGGANLAKEYGIDVLGRIPINTDIMKNSEDGTPIALSENILSEIYIDIANKIEEVLNVKKNDG
jgi:ATP-binding protein involved in chromosome partitioning